MATKRKGLKTIVTMIMTLDGKKFEPMHYGPFDSFYDASTYANRRWGDASGAFDAVGTRFEWVITHLHQA